MVESVRCLEVADGFQILLQTVTFGKMTGKHKERPTMPPVAEVHWYKLVPKMGEAPTVKELRSMSGVLKKVNLGPYESVFLWPG